MVIALDSSYDYGHRSGLYLHNHPLWLLVIVAAVALVIYWMRHRPAHPASMPPPPVVYGDPCPRCQAVNRPSAYFCAQCHASLRT